MKIFYTKFVTLLTLGVICIANAQQKVFNTHSQDRKLQNQATLRREISSLLRRANRLEARAQGFRDQAAELQDQLDDVVSPPPPPPPANPGNDLSAGPPVATGTQCGSGNLVSLMDLATAAEDTGITLDNYSTTFSARSLNELLSRVSRVQNGFTDFFRFNLRGDDRLLVNRLRCNTAEAVGVSVVV